MYATKRQLSSISTNVKYLTTLVTNLFVCLFVYGSVWFLTWYFLLQVTWLGFTGFLIRQKSTDQHVYRYIASLKFNNQPYPMLALIHSDNLKICL